MSELQLLNKLIEREHTPAEKRGIENAKEKIQSTMFDNEGDLRSDHQRIYWLEDMLTRTCMDLEMYREKLGECQKMKR